jgi:hypothetical protein
MNSRHFPVLTACLITITTLGTAAAQTGPASGTLQINGCAASLGAPAQSWTDIFGDNLAQPPMPPNLMVSFENTSTKPIKSVQFGLVRNGNVVAMARDVGMFDSNAVIMHSYALPIGSLHGDTSGTCIPLRIEYADGTTWTNPNLPGKPGK